MPIDSLYTFDPTKLVMRLNEVIPGTVVCNRDYMQGQLDRLRQAGASAKIMRTVESDALRRGPVWIFRIYTPEGPIRGAVERRKFWIDRRDQPLPEGLKLRFLELLESYAIPGATVASYRLERNTRTLV